MKIALRVTVEMTPEQAADYCRFEGVERDEIRDDVKRYVENALQEVTSFTDGAADVTVRAAS